ncbi:MAG: type II toxin-antitoxin system HigB family toxin [Proteobacteria bacterium]|nr:type II toxin-antitoxin system HigB family toxin [Pseudomonadota bacterium]
MCSRATFSSSSNSEKPLGSKANDYRLIALVEYQNGVVMIRFFGSHEDYDKVNAETV